MSTSMKLTTSSPPVLKNGVLLFGVTISGPGWLRFAILRVPVEDLPLRAIVLSHGVERAADQLADEGQDPLELWPK